MNKTRLIIVLSVLLLVGGGVTAAQVSAQRERPLADLALRRSDFPADTLVLTQGELNRDNLAHPLNSETGLKWHLFQQAVNFTGVTNEIQFGHYLYRYKNASIARKQAEKFVNVAKGIKSKSLSPQISLDTLLNKDDTGTTIRVTDPETGGYYYWYVATRGRDLSLLIIGGLPNEKTFAAFNTFKRMVSRR